MTHETRTRIIFSRQSVKFLIAFFGHTNQHEYIHLYIYLMFFVSHTTKMEKKTSVQAKNSFDRVWKFFLNAANEKESIISIIDRLLLHQHADDIEWSTMNRKLLISTPC